MPVLWLKMDFGNMRFRRLGKTNLKLSEIGLGTWAFGGTSDWGPINFEDAQTTVETALEVGINWIDSAPIYGQSEERLGRILKGKRNRVLLSTKCGLVKNGSWTDHDLRAQTICTQLETSLRLLQTDYIDIYWIHYLDPKIPWQAVGEVLSQLKQQGKIRVIGVCNVSADIVREMARANFIDCVQNEFSVLHPQSRPVLEVCQQNGLGFVAYGGLCGGILTGKYKKEPNFRRADARNYFYKCYRGDSFIKAQETVGTVREMAATQGVSAAEIALGWVLAHAPVTSVLSGARNASQIKQNVHATTLKLNAEELCQLAK